MEKYEITGMSCAACVARVEKATLGVEGVLSCSVNLLTASMVVEGDADEGAIAKAVSEAGYGAIKIDENSEITDTSERFLDKETPILRRRLLLSLGFLIVLMYISMGHVMWGWYLPSFIAENPVIIVINELILALAVIIINRKFFINGIGAVLHGSANMDTLVALGSGVSFLYSTYLFIEMLFAQDKAHYLHELYFESSAMILALITIGKLLEARAKGKTTSALKALMDLSPKIATVIVDGEERTIRASELKVGDILAVRAGEMIPADAIIIEGEASIDESTLTGESVPVDKRVGDTVSASTISRAGFIKCRAERTGSQTAIAQIIKTVTDATATKAPIAKIADRVSGIFVPTIIAIAVFVCAIWLIIGEQIGFALGRAISVLVISCPCALGLATPVAIMVGSGVGARNGILFKTASALEQSGRIEIVALDKTGTITSGKMSVRELLPSEGLSESELLSLATSAELRSEHPLAKAIVARANQLEIEVMEPSEFETLTGSGVRARINDVEILGGKRDFICNYAHIPEDFDKKAENLASEGKTPLFFAKDGEFIGIIAISDTVKQSSKEAISYMKRNGLRVVMITGDNEHTARAIAGEVGIDEVISGAMPNEKQEHIKRLAQSGRVAMVGDGVNDAPALALADVGIAIGAGTDVAIDTAQVVIMRSELSDVASAIKLSRASLKNIKENLFWAFFYNVIAIPIAAGALSSVGLTLSPMIGALAMSLSSVCVVSNALRLSFFKPILIANKTEEENDMVTVIKVQGMMCPHCEARVKSVLEAIEGVSKATPNHKKGIVKVEFDAPVDVQALKNAINEAGYKA